MSPSLRNVIGGRVPSLPTSASRGGALAERATSQVRPLDRRRHVRLVQGADVRSGRHDFIDSVQHIVREDDVHSSEKIVELLHQSVPGEQPTFTLRMARVFMDGLTRAKHT